MSGAFELDGTLNYFCTIARLTGSLGMVLNDGPDRSCCWSSTLRSHEAKLTLTEAIAELIVRAIDMALSVAWIEPIGFKGGNIQALVSDIDSHLELLTAGHPSAPSLESSKPG